MNEDGRSRARNELDAQSRPVEDARSRSVEVDLDVVQNVDVNGGRRRRLDLDLARRPPGSLRILVEESRPMVNVEVDDGVNVNGHVNLDDGRQGQGPRRRPSDAGPRAARPLPVEVDLDVVQNVDVNGGRRRRLDLDLARRPPGSLRILVEESRPMVNVEVDDGVNVYGHVNVNDGRQGQGPRRRPSDAGARAARPQPS
jgi:hypothetical protein